jgi:hypothetical protein
MANKNYKTVTHSVAIELPKSQEEVFNRLTNLKKWCSEDFDGNDIKLNSEFVFITGDSHFSKNKVIEFVPNEKLVWLTTEAIRKTDSYDWSGTKMVFELTPKGKNTIIKFAYDGVVFDDEYDRLVMICDMTLKEMFYNFIMYGKGE